MTDEQSDPRELLASVRVLTRKVLAAQRGTWFPLLVFGLISLGVIPVAQHGGHRFGACTGHLQTGQPTVCKVYSVGLLVYWSVALAIAYAAIAGFYMYRARRRGVGTRVVSYVSVGVAIAVLVTGAALWSVYHPSGSGSWLSGVLNQSHTPATAIGLALLVLAWVEGNPALAWFGLGYLAVVLLPSTFFPDGGGQPALASPVPRQLIIAGVLLLGSLGFAVFRPAAAGHKQ